MSVWRGVRWSSAWVFLPLTTLAAYFGAYSASSNFGGYQLDAVSQAWICLVVVCPLLACWGAWDAGRLRPWLEASFGGAHRGKAVLITLAPAMAATICMVSMALMFVTGVPESMLAWLVTGVAIATMVAACLLGIALGTVIARLIAAPLALFAIYALTAVASTDASRRWTPAVLTGVVGSCCAPTEQVSLKALFICALVTAMLGASAALALLAPWSRPARGLALSTMLTLSLLFGLLLGSTLPARGSIVPRTTAQVCQPFQAGEVCSWPENGQDLQSITALINQAVPVVVDLGLPVPQKWTQNPADRALHYVWAQEASMSQRRYALGIDIAYWAGCVSGQEGAIEANDEQIDALATYTAWRLGSTIDELMDAGSDIQTSLAPLLPKGDQAVLDWARQQIARCHR